MMLVDERLARRVGAITLLVLATAIAGAVFLLDRLDLRTPVRIHVAFHHVAGLREHAPLVVAGRAVGRIEAIAPVPYAKDGVLAGDIGVAATVAIAPALAWQVPGNAEIFIASRGPLSDKFLEVSPPHGEPAPPGPAVHEGQELRGIDPPDLDNVLQHTWVNLTTFQLFVATVKPELTALRSELARLRDQLAGVAAEAGVGPADTLRETRALISAARATHATTFGGATGVDELRAMLADARQVVGQLHATIDLLAPKLQAFAEDVARVRDHVAQAAPIDHAVQAFDAARAAVAKIDPVLANLDALAARIASGEGTIGRILSDPEFPEDTRDLGKLIKRAPWKVMEMPDDYHQLKR